MWTWRVFAVLAYAVIVGTGMVVVAVRDPVVATPRRPIAADEIDWSRDLARWEAGARARASSYHNRGQHHPLFAIDGERRPQGPLAKWASWRDDPAPWLAVDLPARTDVERIVLAHAGVLEPEGYSVPDYQLVCLRDGREIERKAITEAPPQVATHELACAGATTVRVEFDVDHPASLEGVARLYEIEIYGKESR